MPLRNYQQQASDAAISHIKKSTDPCLIVAATGAGKSHIIAEIASVIHRISNGKHVLCLAPSAELVQQNTEKYRATGNKCSVFSASAGALCMRHPVVFGTPGTVKNRVRRFGSQFGAVVVDEAHEITPTIKYIIEAIKECSPNLRVIGLTATPYRLGDGYIYAIDENDKPVPESATRNPYFTKKVCDIPAHMLIDRGYLTRPTIGEIGAEEYDTSFMQLNSMGRYNSTDVDRAFHGHGRKTSRIIADVVRKSQNKKGVMVFAATLQHAAECMASLPPEISAIIDGGTKKPERKRIIKDFKSQKIKYLVNVQVLTRGFDASHVDVIAILRRTESVALLQQIIGRGLRIDGGKKDCLILDYAGNVETHCPDGDLFSPEVKAAYKGSESAFISASCPDCNSENTFSARKNDDGFDVDENGYFVDLDKNRIKTDHGDMPAHFGRRCMGMALVAGAYRQCFYRWTSKKCLACDADNDIAARYCSECKAEIIDPNEKLAIDFKRMKRDPSILQTDKVVSWDKKPTMSRAGNECLRVDFVTEYRRFSFWYRTEETKGKAYADWHQFCEGTNHGEDIPVTITYRKDSETGFYRIFDFNRPNDEVQTV